MSRFQSIAAGITTLVLLVAVAGVFVALPVHEARAAGGSFGGGDGSAGNPYRITDALDLQNMSSNLSAHYALDNDIDASSTLSWTSGAGFAPVGNYSNNFSGSLDGRGHTITGLFINLPSTTYVGLLGCIGTGGSADNVSLVNVTITGRNSVGGLVGYSDGSVNNSHATGNVSGTGYDVGGLVGCNYYGTVSNSYSSVNVSGTGEHVARDAYIGGLAGYNDGSINNSHATGDVSGIGWYVGGLVGRSDRSVSNSYATGNVSGNYVDIGGLVGFNYGFVSSSYATGSVSGTGEYAGGLLGYNLAVVNDSYATGNVNGSDGVGGLLGYNYYIGIVDNSYSTGNASGTSNLGGLVGDNDGSVYNSFWDTQTSGRAGPEPGGTGMNTSEMKTRSTFINAGWDFICERTNGTADIWGINEDGIGNNGYPFLSWQGFTNKVTFALTTSSTTGGSVTTPGEATYHYNCGTVQNITATPDSGYNFVRWSGNNDTIADPNAESTNITVSANCSIQAEFASMSYNLSIASSAGGNVTTPGESTYPYSEGSIVNLVADIDCGYHFVNWSGGTDAIADVYNPVTTITMNDNYSITANFANSTFVQNWHTFYGSPLNDSRAYAVTQDSAGNIYVTGRSKDTWDGPDGQPPLHAHSDSGTAADVFILKLAPNGSYLWHTFYGRSGTADSVDYGYGIAASGSDVYVTGFSYGPWNGSGGQLPRHNYSGTADYHSDIFVLKLNSNGAYQWHTFYGSDADADEDGQSDEGMGLVIDSGNVYVTGISRNTWQGDHDTSPLHPFAGTDNWNIVVLKLNSSGGYQWHTFYGTADSSNEGFAIARDASSNIFVTGHSDGTWQGNGDTSPLHAYSGGSDIVVLKLNSSGGYKWHTFYGSETGDEECRGIAVDSGGNVFVTGTSDISWNGSADEVPIHALAGNHEITVLKLNNSGAYQWHTFYGSDKNDYGLAIGIDGSSNAYIVGRSYLSWRGDDNRNPLHPYSGGADIAVLQLTSAGAYGWHTFYGSSEEDDNGQAIAVNASGVICVAGFSPASWLGDCAASPLHAYNGSRDVFVFSEGSTLTPTPTPTPTPTTTPRPGGGSTGTGSTTTSTPTITATPTSTVEPTATPIPTPTHVAMPTPAPAQSNGGTGTWVTVGIVAGIEGLAILACLIILLRRRRA